ncbi:MAG: lamin tail domain-containing protein, partial [Planctomycetales bacterium]|nr:lamin tail domain-containing protein [Planctomycetales bacterium]
TTEFIELTNISSGPNSQTIDLSRVTISNGPSVPYVFPAGTMLAAGQYVVVARDPVAFAAAYPGVAATSVFGPFVGSLNNGGEKLRLDDAQGSTILEFVYGDDARWTQRADGVGASLELIDLNTPVDSLSKPQMWRGSVDLGGSPARANSPALGVVINEVLAKPDLAANQVDQIELLNTTNSTIDLSGWYLSDTRDNLKRYALPVGTTIAARGFLVVSETQFGAGVDGFGLDGDLGDSLYLVESDRVTGVVTRFADDVAFGAARTGESWGLPSDGHGRFVPLASQTFGASNDAARVGPLIISELNYHPASPSSVSLAIDPGLSQDDLEYVEIFNPTANVVDLSGWQIRGTIDYDFRAGATISAGSVVLVLPFNPDNLSNAARTAAFRSHYHLDTNVELMGGYQGQLDDSNGRVTLQSPSTTNGNAAVSMWRQDEVVYDDSPPWPVNADGSGATLTRVKVDGNGNVSVNWRADVPTPGQLTEVDGDLNSDGQVTVADIDFFCGAYRNGNLSVDLDGSGTVDLADLQFLLTYGFGSTIGDANLDGIFNSSDLVQVFQFGEYEDAVANNSGWADGDWNCDGEFSTQDLVAAFQAGSFVPFAIPLSVAATAQSNWQTDAATRLTPTAHDMPAFSEPEGDFEGTAGVRQRNALDQLAEVMTISKRTGGAREIEAIELFYETYDADELSEGWDNSLESLSTTNLRFDEVFGLKRIE